MLNSTDAATQSRAAVLAEVTRVVVTSVVTETVRPTWIFTESVVVFTNTVISEKITSLSETSPQGAEPTETAQMRTSAQSLQVDNTAPTSVSTTVPPMVNPASRSAESWPGSLGPLTVQTSWELVPTFEKSSSSQSPSPSSSESSSSPTLVTTSTSVRPSVQPSVLPSMSSSTLASTLFIETTPSTSPVTISPISPSHTPPYTPLTGPGSDSSSSQSPSGKSHGHSPSTATIVGSAIGGAAAVALSLLACILFFRRKRSLAHGRRTSRQRLLRTSDSISSIEGFHRQGFSQPLQVAESPVMSSAPVFLPRRYSIPLDSRPSTALAISYPNLSHGKAYRYGVPPHNPLDPFTDPENRPLDRRPLSPIIEVSPPSRTASVYSRASWDGGLKVLESQDSTQVSPHNYSYPSQSTLTLETTGSGSRCLNTPESHSRRSDPFDLEPPPNTLQWPLTSGPLPNRWGDPF